MLMTTINDDIFDQRNWDIVDFKMMAHFHLFPSS